jgi:mannose-6-phosphate isomerase
MIDHLAPRRVERVWGTRDLPAWAPGEEGGDAPIGEIWFEEPDGRDRDLLVKLLFTRERLSIQVHPDDAAAQAIGHRRGKDEAWLVLDAEPDAVIGLGLRHRVTKDELREAALSGAIEQLIDWRPVAAGQVYFSPAGTVHAIGAGLTIMEIQQNLDLTYRLFDYGRPRELHLDAGIAAADPVPWRPGFAPCALAPGRALLHAGGAFVMERWTGSAVRDVDTGGESVLLIPTRDGGAIDGEPLKRGSVLRVEGRAKLAGDRDLIVAYPGGEALAGLLA